MERYILGQAGYPTFRFTLRQFIHCQALRSLIPSTFSDFLEELLTPSPPPYLVPPLYGPVIQMERYILGQAGYPTFRFTLHGHHCRPPIPPKATHSFLRRLHSKLPPPYPILPHIWPGNPNGTYMLGQAGYQTFPLTALHEFIHCQASDPDPAFLWFHSKNYTLSLPSIPNSIHTYGRSTAQALRIPDPQAFSDFLEELLTQAPLIPGSLIWPGNPNGRYILGQAGYPTFHFTYRHIHPLAGTPILILNLL
ncbi:hypothetical protein AVEN_96855-1 [Araneus ventricosus]|uniref:Uncharacterized protein n=1 Tax=Araneus ventricosus TaxID=182803 RepID=A0A4Y2SU36_ARAVE|nr:hypothetical protein AVEN_96855-1 [Araneus ventricosus]